MAPTLALHGRELQHRGDLARGVHADIGKDQEIELVIQDLLQHRLGVFGPQRQMPVGAQSREALAAAVFSISGVVGEDLVARISGNPFQPTEGPDRTIVVDQMGGNHAYAQRRCIGWVALG